MACGRWPACVARLGFAQSSECADVFCIVWLSDEVLRNFFGEPQAGVARLGHVQTFSACRHRHAGFARLGHVHASLRFDFGVRVWQGWTMCRLCRVPSLLQMRMGGGTSPSTWGKARRKMI